MPPTPSRLRTTLAKTATLLAFGCLCAAVRSDTVRAHVRQTQQKIRSLPRVTLWVWQRTEDLRAIDPAVTAIAYLDQTIQFNPRTAAVSSQPRLHELAFPSSTQRIAVVRIEIAPGTALSSQAEQTTLALLLHSASQPGIVALQVDFDATRSQREFYRNILRDLRRQMPPELPLSITALASWCSYDDWIASLPVDEAVPMLFRMEPDRRRASTTTPDLQIREPLCTQSVGLSTHELWPDDTTGRRLYIFPDQGWQRDLPPLAQRIRIKS